MSARTTGILLLVAAALGAFVWFYEIEGEADRKRTAEREKRLFAGLESGDVDSVALTTGDAVAVRAERRDGQWEIVDPLRFPADDAAFEDIVSALVELESEATFETPQGADVYGLDDPDREVRFEVDGEPRSLRTGDEAPLGDGRYVQVAGEAAVHTVPSWRVQNFFEDFAGLRDKRVLVFDPDAVIRLVAAWPGGRVVLVRNEDGWHVEVPVEGPADSETVDRLLSDLRSLRAEGFVDAPPPDEATGLSDPVFRVELGLTPTGEGAGSENLEPRLLALAVGAESSDETHLARAGPDSLYRIPQDRLDDLPREVSAYRFKRLAGFSTDEARSVDLVFRGDDGAPVTIRARRGDGGWSSEPEAMDPAKLERLVEELDGLTAAVILAEHVGPDELSGLGLFPPAAAFVVRGQEEAPLAEVRLGALQGTAGVVAQAGDNPQVFRLGPDLAEHLPVSLEAFRNRFLVVEEPATQAADPELDAFIENLNTNP